MLTPKKHSQHRVGKVHAVEIQAEPSAPVNASWICMVNYISRE